MRHLLIALLSCLSLVTASEAPPLTDSLAEPVPVMVWNRQVIAIRSAGTSASAAERAQRITSRIANLSDAALNQPITVKPVTMDQHQALVFYLNGDLLFALTDEDIAPLTDFSEVERVTRQQLAELFAARAAQRQPEVLLRGVSWALAATVLLAIGLFLLARLARVLYRRLAEARMPLPRLAGVDLGPICRGALTLAIRIPHIALMAVLAYTWLTVVFAHFPYTEPWADALSQRLFRFAGVLGRSAIEAAPGLAMVLVIVIITRLINRGIERFCTSVEDGTIEVTWMQPETAKATRRIASMVMWLFAITVAYPYVPGSNTDAFKGVSVFAGLLLTLGSAGMVNQVMSGLVVVYSRTMKAGDLIQLGDITGRVTELGFLSTKVRTPRGHEVSLPNAMIVGAAVSNFSRFDPEIGPTIAAIVTIGYDTPWRQVHAMLALAATRTAGVTADSKPAILQTALSDFYVEYELRCRIDQVEDRRHVLSDLHAAIQDVFNEYGVQIMSPHFETQPTAAVLVPPAARAPAPALPG